MQGKHLLFIAWCLQRTIRNLFFFQT
jgi:hypothetical protein